MNDFVITKVSTTNTKPKTKNQAAIISIFKDAFRNLINNMEIRLRLYLLQIVALFKNLLNWVKGVPFLFKARYDTLG